MKLRLKQLRMEKGLTQEQAGKLLYVNQSMYSRYESGTLKISLGTAATLAKYYNVSVDYLMGLTDDPSPYPFKNKWLKAYFERTSYND